MLNDKFFISDKIEERPIELDDGTTEVLWFKHLPNTAFERYAIWTNSKDEAVESEATARLVALGLCDPDGKTAVSIDQARMIKPQIMRRIFTALLDVNGYGAKAKAQSAEREAELGNGLPPEATTGSGT